MILGGGRGSGVTSNAWAIEDVPLFEDGIQSRTQTFEISFKQHSHIWGLSCFGF